MRKSGNFFCFVEGGGILRSNTDVMLDLLREDNLKDSDLVPRRNDPCYCKSGKKYKKCCFIKNSRCNQVRKGYRDSLKKELFTITNEPLQNSKDVPLFSDDEYQEWEEHYLKIVNSPNLVNKDDVKYFKNLCDKYQDFPTLWNNLNCAYQALGDKVEAKKISELIFKKFPGYLFGQINMANLYLEEEKVEEAKLILNKMPSLFHFYPNRKEFHISEFISLQTVLLRLAIAKDDIEHGKRLHDSLMKVVFEFERENDAQVRAINFEWKWARFLRKCAVRMNRISRFF